MPYGPACKHEAAQPLGQLAGAACKEDANLSSATAGEQEAVQEGGAASQVLNLVTSRAPYPCRLPLYLAMSAVMEHGEGVCTLCVVFARRDMARMLTSRWGAPACQSALRTPCVLRCVTRERVTRYNHTLPAASYACMGSPESISGIKAHMHTGEMTGTGLMCVAH